MVAKAKNPIIQAKNMKRINNLFDKVIDLENLRLADQKARRGKVYSYGVRFHDKNREANLVQLHEQLKNGTFKTSPYHVFVINEPKERLIYRLPYYPDRILHHAIMNVLEPIWVSVFTKDTYACIKNRGILACAKSVRRALREDPVGTKYCLKIDIKKFYPSINHNVLKGIIRRKIKDTRLLALLDEIIDSTNNPVVVDKKQTSEIPQSMLMKHGTGVPIGNYLSQYFANLQLAYFDHWVKEQKRVIHYQRYADDMVFFAPDKATLHALLPEIRAYLKTLELELKKNYQIFPVDARGVDFVGYVFFHSHTRLRKSIKQNLCRRVAKLNKRKTPLPKAEYKQRICSWWGWMKYCNSINLFNKIKSTMPYEVSFNRPKRTL